MAPAPSIAGASPRASLYSARYEATAVADHDTLSIHLDRFATNAPVTDAALAVEAGPARGPAERLPDGSYRFRHAAMEAPGALALRLEVAEPGQPPDVLAGTLRIGPAPAGGVTDDGHGAPGHAHDGAGSPAPQAAWQRMVPWGLALLALLAVVAGARARRLRHASADRSPLRAGSRLPSRAPSDARPGDDTP